MFARPGAASGDADEAAPAATGTSAAIKIASKSLETARRIIASRIAVTVLAIWVPPQLNFDQAHVSPRKPAYGTGGSSVRRQSCGEGAPACDTPR